MLPAFPKWKKIKGGKATLQLPDRNPLSLSWHLQAGDVTSASPGTTNVCWLSLALADCLLLGVCVSPYRSPIHPKLLCWRAGLRALLSRDLSRDKAFPLHKGRLCLKTRHLWPKTSLSKGPIPHGQQQDAACKWCRGHILLLWLMLLAEIHFRVWWINYPAIAAHSTAFFLCRTVLLELCRLNCVDMAPAIS